MSEFEPGEENEASESEDEPIDVENMDDDELIAAVLKPRKVPGKAARAKKDKVCFDIFAHTPVCITSYLRSFQSQSSTTSHRPTARAVARQQLEVCLQTPILSTSHSYAFSNLCGMSPLWLARRT